MTAAILKAKLESLSGNPSRRSDGSGHSCQSVDHHTRRCHVDADGAFLRISSQDIHAVRQRHSDDSGRCSPEPVLVPANACDRTDSATQSILLPEWQTYSTVRYGVDSVDLLRSMTAAEVEAALESLDSIRDVWVAGSGRIIRTDTLQRQSIPGVSIAVGMIFKYGINTVTLAAGDIGTDTADQATKLQTQLRTLTGMSTVDRVLPGCDQRV